MNGELERFEKLVEESQNRELTSDEMQEVSELYGIIMNAKSKTEITPTDSSEKIEEKTEVNTSEKGAKPEFTEEVIDVRDLGIRVGKTEEVKENEITTPEPREVFNPTTGEFEVIEEVVIPDVVIPDERNVEKEIAAAAEELKNAVNSEEIKENEKEQTTKGYLTKEDIINQLEHELSAAEADYNAIIEKIKHEGYNGNKIKAREELKARILSLREELADYGINNFRPLADEHTTRKKGHKVNDTLKKAKEKIKETGNNIKNAAKEKANKAEKEATKEKTSKAEKETTKGKESKPKKDKVSTKEKIKEAGNNVKDFTKEKFNDTKNFVSNHKKGAFLVILVAVAVAVTSCSISKAVKNSKNKNNVPNNSYSDDNQIPNVPDNVVTTTPTEPNIPAPEVTTTPTYDYVTNMYLQNPDYNPVYYNYYEENRNLYNVSVDKAIDLTNRAFTLSNAGYGEMDKIIPILIAFDDNTIYLAENIEPLSEFHAMINEIYNRIRNGEFDETDENKLNNLPYFVSDDDKRNNIEQLAKLLIARIKEPNKENKEALKKHCEIFVNSIGGVTNDPSILTDDEEFNKMARVDSSWNYFGTYQIYSAFMDIFTEGLSYPEDKYEIEFWQGIEDTANAYYQKDCQQRTLSK